LVVWLGWSSFKK